MNFNPLAASFSATGVSHGPPNALDEPKPTSSSRMTRTFGAPAGGSTGSIGGNRESGSLASYVVSSGLRTSGMGRIERACLSAWLRNLVAVVILPGACPWS